MMNNGMKFIGTVLLASLCLSACSDVTTEGEGDTSLDEIRAAQALVRLPDCASLPEHEFNDRGQANCIFASSDDPRWRFEIRYGEQTANEDAEEIPVTIYVITDDDRVALVIKENTSSTSGLPLLSDLDKDGRSELLVPLMTGNVNTLYAIWRGTINEPPYVRAGEVSGVGFKLHQDGLFSVASRSNATSWVVTYYRMSDSPLTSLATTLIELADAGDNTQTCSVTDNGGLELLGQTLAEAHAQFCNAG